MKIIDEKQIAELLPKFEFRMVNFGKHTEDTVLDENDVDNILHDLKHGVTVEQDENGKVTVTYPGGVCDLESIRELETEGNKK